MGPQPAQCGVQETPSTVDAITSVSVTKLLPTSPAAVAELKLSPMSPTQVERLNPSVTTPPPRSGKQLWKKAQSRIHAYHNVTHELKHRAQEKATFGVAELVLSRTAAYAAHFFHSAEVVVRVPAARKWWSGVDKLVGKLRRAAQRGFRRRMNESVVHAPSASVSHHSGHHVPATTFHRSMHLMHVAIPLAGTYLIAHMAHHDLHRAQREWRTSRALVPTMLFYFGFLCDAFDATAHALIVLCLVLPESDLLNHHVEHELHSASLVAAIFACAAMMLGETIVARTEQGHKAAQLTLLTKLKELKAE